MHNCECISNIYCLLTDTAAGCTDQFQSTVAEGISHLKLSGTLQATETSPQNGNNELLYFVECLIYDLSLLIYAATLSQGQTSQPHFTTITGSDTTPKVPPVFKQKSKVKLTNHAKCLF